MKFIKILLTLAVLVLIGGFIALGFIDIPVEQQEVIKDVPVESLLNE